MRAFETIKSLAHKAATAFFGSTARARNTVLGLILALGLLLLWGAYPRLIISQSEEDEAVRDIVDYKTSFPDVEEQTSDQDTGTGDKPKSPSLDLPKILELPLDPPLAVLDEGPVETLLAELAAQIGLSEGSKFVVKRGSADKSGNRYIAIEQQHNGLKVHGSEALIEISGGFARILYGAWWPDLSVADVLAATPQAVMREALSLQGVPPERPFLIHAEPKQIIVGVDGSPRVAWEVLASLQNPAAERVYYIVDAQSAEILSQIREHLH